ncbi:MAG: NTP transferase domain-containing protein [Candidatus Aminicenantes bacterium]|nr:NTP transferase domain-containing protein [Candidatus Aminicenantes bacterium]
MKDLFLCNGQSLSLIVLAGGSSRRMQWDKALLPAPEGTIIEHILNQLEEHFNEVLISVSSKEKFTFLKRRLIVDDKPDEGPMMGIKTALQASRNEKNFVIACDIPDIDLGFLQRLIREAEHSDIALPISPGGRKEPLFAVYSKSVLPEIEKLLDEGVLSLLPLFERCKVRYVPMGESVWFKNLNTRKDYKNFLKQKNRPLPD